MTPTPSLSFVSKELSSILQLVMLCIAHWPELHTIITDNRGHLGYIGKVLVAECGVWKNLHSLKTPRLRNHYIHLKLTASLEYLCLLINLD
jgi:hypothetical protein